MTEVYAREVPRGGMSWMHPTLRGGKGNPLVMSFLGNTPRNDGYWQGLFGMLKKAGFQKKMDVAAAKEWYVDGLTVSGTPLEPSLRKEIRETADRVLEQVYGPTLQ